MNMMLTYTFIGFAILGQITASRKPRAIGFECQGDALSPIVIDQVIRTNKFSDFIQTKSHDVVPNSIGLTKNADMGFLRATPGYNAKDIPKIIGGPLNTSYSISHIDFHWGEHDLVGSEHIVGHHQYPMEIRAIYFNDKYTNIAQAYAKLDGMAIVSYFVKVSRKPNPAIGRLLEKFNVLSLNAGTQSVALTYKFPLSKLLGYFRDDYFTYTGSYTKFDLKPCGYNVQWIIPRQPIEISEGQMKMFRGLAEKSPLFLNNYSDVEPLNNRTVYHQKKRITDRDCGCQNRIDIRIEK